MSRRPQWTRRLLFLLKYQGWSPRVPMVNIFDSSPRSWWSSAVVSGTAGFQQLPSLSEEW